MNNPRFSKKGPKRILKVLQTQLNTQRISSSIDTTQKLHHALIIPASSLTMHQMNSPQIQTPFKRSLKNYRFNSLSPNQKSYRYRNNKTNFTIKEKKFTTLSVSQSKKSKELSVSKQEMNNPYLSGLKKIKTNHEDKNINSIIIDSKKKSGRLRKSGQKLKAQSIQKKSLSNEKYKKFHTRIDSIRQQSQSSFNGFYDSVQYARNLTDNGQNRKALLLLKTLQQNFINGSTKKLSCQTIESRNSIAMELQIYYLKIFNWHALQQWQKTFEHSKYFLSKLKNLTSRCIQKQQQWKYFYVKTVAIFLICISTIKINKMNDALVYLEEYLAEFQDKLEQPINQKPNQAKCNISFDNKKALAIICLIAGVYYKDSQKISKSIGYLQNCNNLLNQLLIQIQVTQPNKQRYNQNLDFRQLEIQCLQVLADCLCTAHSFQKCVQILQLKLQKMQMMNNYQRIQTQKKQERSLSTLQAHMSSLQHKNKMKLEDVTVNFERVLQRNHSRQASLDSWIKNLIILLRENKLIGLSNEYNQQFVTELRIAKLRIQIAYRLQNQSNKKDTYKKILSNLMDIKNNLIQQSTIPKQQKYTKYYFRQTTIERLLLNMILGEIYYLLADFNNALVFFEQVASLVRFDSQLILEDNKVEIITYQSCITFILLIKLQQYSYHEAARTLQNYKKSLKQANPTKSKQVVDILQLFIEGTVLIIKRYFDEGSIKLQNLQKIISIISNYNSKNIYMSEAIAMIKSRINLIYAFSSFCLKKYDLCRQALLQQRKIATLQEQEFVINYNEELCQGVINFQQRNYDQAFKNFSKVHNMNPKKIDSLLSIVITLIKKYQPIQNMQQKIKFQPQIKNVFEELIHLVQKLSNNVSSVVFYHKGIFHGYLQQWRQAIYCIDQAIQRSQQNFWKFFYARASILAACNNFSQAINDSSIASSLNPTKPQPYLLRSKCLQIQGQSNQAFQCLQNYLALKPDDKQIHKYAGHLLFQNGAFEDALAAFSHSQIEQFYQNYHVFQTRGKTNFLLGHFKQAAKDFQVVYNLDKSIQCNAFDAKIMNILADLHKVHIQDKGKLIQIEQPIKKKGQRSKKKLYDRVNPSRISMRKESQPIQQEQKQTYLDIIKIIEQTYSQWQLENYGKIFADCEKYSMIGLCLFYEGKLEQARQNFSKAIEKKNFKLEFKKSLKNNEITEDNLRDQEKDFNLYCSQMYYNISLCYLIEENIEEALKAAMKCPITQSSPYLNRFKVYIQFLSRKNIQNWLQLPTKQIFPIRSKMTNYFHPFKIILPKNILDPNNKKKICKKQRDDQVYQFETKLCVPFPKVQPPEISPTFDNQLLQEFSVLEIDIKPETPWVKHDLQQNCMKFTDNIEEYSQLKIDDTNKSQSQLIKMDDGSQSHLHNRSFMTILPNQHSKSIKHEKILDLNLPLETEKKLQKILKKRVSMK